VLHPYPAQLALVSKVGARRNESGAWLPAQKPDELRAGVEENLRTLEVDRLAAVNLRRHDDGETTLDEQPDAMIEMRDHGLFDGIGLSNVGLAELEHALGRTEIVGVQNAYTLADRSSEGVLERCEDLQARAKASATSSSARCGSTSLAATARRHLSLFVS
jgi:aryl-alcohol dehydrogenase-like predicted oxidoreductase